MNILKSANIRITLCSTTPFQSSQLPLHRRILARIEAHPDRSLLAELEEGVARLRSGESRLGVLMEATSAEFVAGRCSSGGVRLGRVGRLAEGGFGFAFSRGE